MIEPWNELHRITLENEFVKVILTELGASIQSFCVKHSDGTCTDIVLGYDSPEEYLADDSFFMGTIPARHAGRIKNGHCPIGATVYQLALRGEHALHTGGLHHTPWEYSVEDNTVTFTHHSPHDTDGLPGNLRLAVVYSLQAKDLVIKLQASTDQTTVVNLTNHAYFNLEGVQTVRDVLTQRLQVFTHTLTELDDACIPTGNLINIANSAYDFTQIKAIGRDIAPLVHGYDHNYVFTDSPKFELEGYQVTEMAKACAEKVQLTVLSSQPGLQLYTGKYLSTTTGKYGQQYTAFAGFCMEAQHFPDAVHHPHFPSTILSPDQKFDEIIVFRAESLS